MEVKNTNFQSEFKSKDAGATHWSNGRSFLRVPDSLPEGIQVIDFNWRYVYINDAVSRHTEIPREELLGYTMMEKYPGIEHTQLFKVFQECMVERMPLHFENEFIMADSTKRWFEYSVNPVEEGIFVFSTDITGRKEAEFNLQERNRELVEINSRQDRFVYAVAHDLRSPLASILGLLFFIKDESKEPLMLKHIEMIRNRITRLDEYIKGILNYSRSNHFEPVPEEIPVQHTVNEIIDSLRTMRDAEEITFQVEIEAKQPFYSDKQDLIAILENLISNAIKYHKKDSTGRYIKVTGRCDTNHLHLGVEDNGIGISPVYQQQIFDKFFRLPSQSEGTGIGLYLVREIIEKLKGTVTVSSKEGVGTLFNVTLKNMRPA